MGSSPRTTKEDLPYFSKSSFEKYASKFYYPERWYGKRFDMGRDIVKVVGVRPRAKRYPIVVERITDGELFGVEVDQLHWLEQYG